MSGRDDHQGPDVDKTAVGSRSGVVSRSVVRRAIEDSTQEPLFRYEARVQEATVNRIWNRIQEPKGVRPRGAFFLQVAGALLVCIALAFVVARRPSPLQFDPEGAVPLGKVVAAAATERSLRFDDGSEILLRERSELSVLSNEGASFVVALRSGRARFSVEPGGPRKWMVDAGELSVEVVGTVFVVERTHEAVVVSVERGKVVVTGAVEGDRVILQAGEQVKSESMRHAESVQKASRALPIRPSDGATLPSTPEVGSPAEPKRVAGVATEVTLQQLEDEATTQPDGALPSVGRTSQPSQPKVAEEKSDLADLLNQADDAKRAGDGTRAGELYLRIVRESASGDPRKGIAALSYARISTDPALVAEVLSGSIASVPAGLRESAWLRLVHAYEQNGDREAARAAAERYVDEFPGTGRRYKTENTTAEE